MQKTQSFFKFLKEHIVRGGFQEYKSKYSQKGFYEKLIPVDEDGFGNFELDVYVEENYLEEKVQYEDFVFRNEKQQMIKICRRKTNLLTNEISDEEVKEYLIDELEKRYIEEYGTFLDNFADVLMNFKSEFEKKNYLDGIIIKIRVYIDRVNNSKFNVLDKQGVSKNLIQILLLEALNFFESYNLNNNSETKEIVSLEYLNSEGKNIFNGMPLKMVIEHFKPLTTLTSKSGNKPHLTNEQFEQFINAAFLNFDPNVELNPKIKINRGENEKGKIKNIFYDFYIKSKIEYESSQSVKNKYVRLLTDYFTGYDFDTVHRNFNKK